MLKPQQQDNKKPLQVIFLNSAFSSKIIVPHEICAYQTVSVKIYNTKKTPTLSPLPFLITFRLSAYIFTFPSSVISESTLSFYTFHYNSIPLSYALFHLFFPSFYMQFKYLILSSQANSWCYPYLNLCFQLTQSIFVAIFCNFVPSSIVKHFPPFSSWYLKHLFAS